MSANDDFSLHDDEELSLHDDASLAGSVPASNKGDAPAKPPQIITTNTLSNIKLPVLQKDDYDTWAMEMEHYLEYIDNEVWKVIQNGNSKKRVTKGKDGVYRVLPPTTQAEQVADEKERKARTLLLMAVPKDHLRRFHGMDDAKEIWAAIKTRFGGNANSKKMQKAVLKQQFEAFTISSKESLEKGYDRFQKLLSQLDALGAGVSDEDANHKFLRSLPPAWDSLAMTMRTKKNIDTLSIDDLYNNLSVFEQDIQKTSSSSITSDNVAFLSQAKSSSKHKPSHNSGSYSSYTTSSSKATPTATPGLADEVIHSFLATNADDVDLIHEDLDQIDDLDLEEMDINWQIAMTAIKIKKFYKKTGRRPRVDGKMHVAFDKRKVECFNCHNTGHFARECKFKGSKEGNRQEAGKGQNFKPVQIEKEALMTIDEGQINWVEQTTDEELNHALMAFTVNNEGHLESNSPRHLSHNVGAVTFGGSKGSISGKDEEALADLMLVSSYILTGAKKMQADSENYFLANIELSLSADHEEEVFFDGGWIDRCLKLVFMDKLIVKVSLKGFFLMMMGLLLDVKQNLPDEVYRNKKDERGSTCIRNKAGWLVSVNGKKKGLDMMRFFAPVLDWKHKVTPKGVSHLYAVQEDFQGSQQTSGCSQFLGRRYYWESERDVAANLDMKEDMPAVIANWIETCIIKWVFIQATVSVGYTEIVDFSEVKIEVCSHHKSPIYDSRVKQVLADATARTLRWDSTLNATQRILLNIQSSEEFSLGGNSRLARCFRLIEKVKKLENKLRQKRKSEEIEDEENAEDLKALFVACITERKPKSTPTPTKILDFEEPAKSQVNTGSTPSAQVNTGSTPSVHINELRDLQAEVQASEKSKELHEIAEQEEEAAKEALATEFDYIQARLNADQIFAEKIQQEEKGALFY
ncbi:ribonuclease H-like domain-containing protein [Tanacetum coccineum]